VQGPLFSFIALNIYRNVTQQPEWLDNDTRIFYEDYETYDGSRFIKRAQAEATIKQGQIHHTQKSYNVSREATELLRKLDVHSGTYHVCFGNQLQHVLHQECVDLIERIAQLKPDSPIFEYQSALAYCIDAAQTYNKVGRTYNASMIADFCYTLFDYTKAVLEGARDGLVGVGQQALNNPLQTVASVTLFVAAAEYMLAYQLGKIVYGVLNLTVNAVINPEKAQKTWDGYITPISNLIDALKNKQISLRDGIRAGTALAVSMKAQSMLAKGCEKLYSVARIQVLEFVTQNNFVDSCDYQEFCGKGFFKVINQSTERCPATCRGQYRKLKEALRREQFSAIVKCTAHGYERLIERRFEPQEVWDLLHKFHIIRTQSDGAKVFIRQIADKYNIIILNESTNELITALKHTTLKKIVSLGENYGWKI
jgi:hypothetical protein